MADKPACRIHGEVEFTPPDQNGMSYCTECYKQWQQQGLMTGDLEKDEELPVVKSGVLSQAEIANIVCDSLGSRMDDTRGAVVDLSWVPAGPNEFACQYVIRKPVDQPAYEDPEAMACAEQAIKNNPELVAKVKARKPGTLNHMVGEVMRAIHQKTGKVEPEKSFELVVNLLGMVDEDGDFKP